MNRSRVRTRPRGPRIPGPRSRPHTLARFALDPARCVLELTRDHGDVVDLGFGSYVLISRPEHVAHVLQTNETKYWRGARAHRRSGGLFGDGLAYADGEPWQRQRRRLVPSFTPKAVAHYVGAMTEVVLAELDSWRGAAREAKPIDLRSGTAALAQNTIAAALFQSEIRDQGADVARALAGLARFVGRAMRAPVFVPPWVPTPGNLRFRRAVGTLDAMMIGLIEEARESGPESGGLLAKLVHAPDPETGELMSDRQLRDELVTLFVAGHESTSNALAWCFALLSSHPDVRERLEKEVEAVIGDRLPTHHDLDSLRYTEAVIREVLRLYPPSWMMIREPRVDDHIGGYRIPAGTSLLISPFATHRRPEHWPDPERFDPDRFAESEIRGRHRYAWYPFGGGPRVCLGLAFAMTELKLTLALVTARCRLHRPPGLPLRPDPRLTLEPAGDLRMRVEWRHD